MNKITLTLYVRKNCSLCDKAREILKRAGGGKNFLIREIDIEKDPLLLNMFSDKVPVIEIANKEYIFYPFDKKRVLESIKKFENYKEPVKIYNRNSKFYDFMESPMEILTFKGLRERFFKKIFKTADTSESKILEIGIGTGKNIPYYPDKGKFFGMDIAIKMLQKAKEKLTKEDKEIFLLNMDAQHLAFKDNSFDIIFTTFVFCSVFDPVQGLREIKRVLKPNGRLYMLEHVRAENPFAGKIMDFLDPLIFKITGAHIARRTKENLIKAGFEVKEEKIGAILRIFTAIPTRSG